MKLSERSIRIKELIGSQVDMGTFGLVELELKEFDNEIEQLKNCNKHFVMHRFPDNPEIWKWWKEQKFQKEQGEQEYIMIYEIDLPKILKAFTEHLLNGA